MIVVVPRPLIFWMRAMLSPATAASRTTSSRLPVFSRCRSLFSAALASAGKCLMQRTLPHSRLGSANRLSRFGDGARGSVQPIRPVT